MIRVAYLNPEKKLFVLKFMSTHIQIINTSKLTLWPGINFVHTHIGLWMPDGSSALVVSGNDTRTSAVVNVLEEKNNLILQIVNHEGNVIFIEPEQVIVRLAIMATGYVNNIEHKYIDHSLW